MIAHVFVLKGGRLPQERCFSWVTFQVCDAHVDKCETRFLLWKEFYLWKLLMIILYL